MIEMWFNSGMNIQTYRRQRLLDYIARHFNGNRANFARKTGLSEQRVAQLLSDTWRDGNNFGEKMARKVEALAEMEVAYLDQGFYSQVDTAPELAAPIAANAPPPQQQQPQPSAPPPPAKSRQEPQPILTPIRLEATELLIVQVYRHAEPETKMAIRKLFRVLPLADEDTIGDLIHSLCRAINERVPLTVAAPPSEHHFTPTEQALLNQFRAKKPSVQKLILLAADCADALPDDEERDPLTGCIGQELRLIQSFRDGSPVLRKAIILAVSDDAEHAVQHPVDKNIAAEQAMRRA